MPLGARPQLLTKRYHIDKGDRREERTQGNGQEEGHAAPLARRRRGRAPAVTAPNHRVFEEISNDEDSGDQEGRKEAER